MNSLPTETQSDLLTITQRNQIKILPHKAKYERQEIYQILDEGLVCHVGFVVDSQPFVIPTAYGRIGESLYIHGSPASRMLRNLKQGIEVCITVTLLDGLVLARSAFHHSMNFRSVVIFGTATVVEDEAEKLAALKAFTEHVVSGRWDEVRPPTSQELAGTLVLSLPITEASAKVRTGPPIDYEEDYALSVWAGELPLRLTTTTPIPDPRLSPEIKLPVNVQNYTRNLQDAV